MSEKVALFSFNPEHLNWKFKINTGGRRLKLYIKMTKGETEQWDQVRSAAKPPDMSDDKFARILFYKGIHSFMQELSEHINSMSDEEKEKILAAQGVESKDGGTEEESASDE